MFHWLDCQSWSESYHMMWKVKNYDPEAQVVDWASANLEMPIFLDEVKATLKKKLLDANSEQVKVDGEEQSQ